VIQESASDLPASSSSPSLLPVDDEKPAGRIWNGYVCPGCQSVFRVAAEFHGTDVICPSCHETLRLPKTPDEKQPLTITPVAMPSKPTKPTRGTQAGVAQTQTDQEPDESTFEMMLATTDGRIKFALAILVPLAVVIAVLLFEPWKRSAPSELAAEDLPSVAEEIVSPAERVPAPPPPPVAVNEMPRTDQPHTPAPAKPEAGPALASAEPPPAVPQPLPEIVEATPQEPAAVPAESAAVIPTPPAPALEEEELVEAVPADSKPVPAEKPEPAPIAQAEVMPAPEPTAAPAPPAPAPTSVAKTTEPVHTVARGDTLTKISRTYQVGVPAIKKANGMRSDVIMLGQQLKIPGGIAPAPAAAKPPAPAVAAPRSHTVVRGDTLERIARKYRVDPRAIMQANGMKTDVVRLGRKLVIPQP
jgi:LysM repeat protein